MTATRLLKGATIILAAAAWFVAAVLLWRTKVPADLHRPRLDASAFFSQAQLHRAARYSSVGQPRDGDPRAGFLLLEPGRRATFHRVDYPIDRTQAEMRERGLPEALAARLGEGL